ncbi:acyl-CoA dehydrogenase family protein [Streptomyces sp. BE303]|uniref:acyl-CoA dehydrogenase family protein n=1 Tax=Streptomyces sp. BE303 TaxID=3002528 RepID=UPI002E7A6BF5|nr:acyl-CoA dehydrogenase family protein [Streptomyces sp. BE303]MED7950958.1 acyl-CoA dehydrogenase family protein [Streptomyces sp. BE303]
MDTARPTTAHPATTHPTAEPPTAVRRPGAPKDLDPVAAARSLVPLLTDQAPRTEERRRLTDTSLTALRRAGLLRLGTPRRFDGHGAGVLTAVDVCEELARGCSAASWFVGIAYGGALFASQLDHPERATLWQDDPDAVVCGTANPSGTARPSAAGWTLNGRWPWISGIHHAPWTLLGFTRDGSDGEPERGMALVPTHALTVEDVWHIAGMRGTGSDTAHAEEVDVPASRTLSLTALAEGAYRGRHPGEPPVTFHLSINPPLVATGVGIAAATLEKVLGAAARGRRTPSPLHHLIAESPAHQLNVAHAAVLIDTARLHLRRAAGEMDAHARAGHRPELADRARLRMDAAHAMRCARQAVSLLLDTAGAGSLADGSDLQRAWRDIETASRHAALGVQSAQEIYGRTLLGAPLPPSPLI